MGAPAPVGAPQERLKMVKGMKRATSKPAASKPEQYVVLKKNLILPDGKMLAVGTLFDPDIFGPDRLKALKARKRCGPANKENVDRAKGRVERIKKLARLAKQ